MKLLLEQWREYLKEQETIAVGQCYPFAVEMSNNSSKSEFADLSKFKVVHGRVTDKFSGESVLHAWVEKGDIVFDSQTSHTKPNGIPKADYYDIYQPEPHEEYTAEETILKCMKTGHKGPWNRINEVTTLEPEVKQGFRQAIVDSNFWNLPHEEYDVVDSTSLKMPDGSYAGETPASVALAQYLNATAQELGTDLFFVVTVEKDEGYVLRDGDANYPNNWLMGAEFNGPNPSNGKNLIIIELRPLEEDFELSVLDPEQLINLISQVVNHEMVHYWQMKKQAESKGLSDEEAWEELLCDPEQVPIGSSQADRDEWEQRCGRAPPKDHHGKEVYLTRHGEIDAYAHEAAEQLLTYMSPEEVMRHLRTSKGVRWAAQQSSAVQIFMDTLARDSKEIRKFWTKLYTQIQQQSQELSEDSDFQKNMKKNLPKELDFLLKKGGNNTKVGPGIKNPKNPKFDSKPPGASGG
jgi:hypothetical protein